MSTRCRTTTAALIALALTAGAAPTASAKPIDPNAPTGTKSAAPVYSRPDKSMIATTLQHPYGGDPSQATVPQPVVRVQAPKSGFDWADAGIGAAGGLALSMIALSGGLAVTQRRDRRTRHSTA